MKATFVVRSARSMAKLQLHTFAARLPEVGTGPRHAFALVELAGELDRAEVSQNARAPLCMALAIDASSSMRGARFALAVQAARDVLDALGPEDRFAVIAFDRVARVVCAPSAADADSKADARRALDRLATGTGTNISSAWRECDDALSRWMIPDAARRIVLLTDGLPSHGELEPEGLRRLVGEGLRRGVETNVVGVGDGIDERLCALIASSGGGRFHFLRDAAQVAPVIAYEVEGARRLVATDVSLYLTFTSRVTRAEVMHRLPCRPDGRTMEISIGPVSAGSPRHVLVQFELDDPTNEATVFEAFARGNWAGPRPVSRATSTGFALGARALLEGPSGDPREGMAAPAVVTLPQGFGTPESRHRVAHTVLWMRTVAEIRSAWDAVETMDEHAVRRRIGRAATLRKQLTDSHLLTADELSTLPDLATLERVMLGPKDVGRENLRRTWHAIDHNTSSSQVVEMAGSVLKPFTEH
jgi:Mg-chelatase subunit ChlD